MKEDTAQKKTNAELARLLPANKAQLQRQIDDIKAMWNRPPECRYFMWGLWDLSDHCWYGSPEGPNVYRQYIFAAGAATLLNEMFRTRSIRVRIFWPGVLVIKDQVVASVSAQEVLQRMRA
jgi:hypothetical protein